jgi:hypothetical protein
MPLFRVTVTASLKPTEYRDGTAGRFWMPGCAPPAASIETLFEWVSIEPGRSIESDAIIDPQRATVTVVYNDVDAPDEREARLECESRFLEECDVVEPSEWETVVAVAAENE